MSEFDPSQPLDDADHECFCQRIANGQDGKKAYMEIYGSSSPKAATSSASRLLTNAKVESRIKHLQTEANQDCRMSKKQRLDFLVDVVRTALAMVDSSSVLCQEETRSATQFGETIKIKMPDKLKAIDMMNRMCGDYAPEKHQDVTEWTPEQKAEIARMAAQSKSALAGMGIGKAKKS